MTLWSVFVNCVTDYITNVFYTVQNKYYRILQHSNILFGIYFAIISQTPQIIILASLPTSV